MNNYINPYGIPNHYTQSFPNTMNDTQIRMAQLPQMQPQQFIQPTQTLNNQIGLLGKIVDSIETAKTTEYPLDGSVSYFALADGSSIVTKQLQNDGTSKIIVYKPVEEEKEKDSPKYVTIEELEEKIAEIDFSDIDDLKEELREIKKQLKEMKTRKSKDD